MTRMPMWSCTWVSFNTFLFLFFSFFFCLVWMLPLPSSFFLFSWTLPLPLFFFFFLISRVGFVQYVALLLPFVSFFFFFYFLLCFFFCFFFFFNWVSFLTRYMSKFIQNHFFNPFTFPLPTKKKKEKRKKKGN